MSRNYDVGPTREITEDLQVTPNACTCSCHTLFGMEAAHVVACCNYPLDDNVKS